MSKIVKSGDIIRIVRPVYNTNFDIEDLLVGNEYTVFNTYNLDGDYMISFEDNNGQYRFVFNHAIYEIVE